MSIFEALPKTPAGAIPGGVLWDMDGTVVDSEPEWDRATKEVVERLGGTWLSEDAAFVIGASAAGHGGRMAEALARDGITEFTAEALFDEVVEAMVVHFNTDITPMPGAGEALTAFKDAGVPQALVTASPKVMVDGLIAMLTRELGFSPFDSFVSGDDHCEGKPDPAPYLLGAERIGVDPANCVAFEDSVHGVASATAAGCQVVDLREITLVELVK